MLINYWYVVNGWMGEGDVSANDANDEWGRWWFIHSWFIRPQRRKRDSTIGRDSQFLTEATAFTIPFVEAYSHTINWSKNANHAKLIRHRFESGGSVSAGRSSARHLGIGVNHPWCSNFNFRHVYYSSSFISAILIKLYSNRRFKKYP